MILYTTLHKEIGLNFCGVVGFFTLEIKNYICLIKNYICGIQTVIKNL